MKNLIRFVRPLGRLLLAATLAIPLIGTLPASAKQYDPYVMYVFPAGGQRGTTVEAVMSRGRGLEGTSEIRISGEGVSATVLAIEEPSTELKQRSANRQDQAENPNVVKFSVTIAPDAEPGERDLWLITPKGATNRLHFVVGQIPEVNELSADELAEKSDPHEPQSLPALPILVNGQYNQGDHDVFRFTAKAGETLVCECQGRKLIPYIADAVPGWFQPCLTLRDSAGNELAYVDDFRFHPDPLLIYKVEKDGEYLIEIKDVLFRGREDLIYRLSIGALPYITHVYPLGGPKGSDAKVELYGANLPEASTNFAVPDDSPPLRHVQTEAAGLTSNALPFAVGSSPESEETEPNDSIEQANKIETPQTINGRIQNVGDIDYFLFTAKKSDRLIIDVRARRLESPLDSVITLLNSTGRWLAENDDTTDLSQGLITHHADSYLAYTVPADGDYVLRLADIQGHGGEEYAYRVTIGPPRPDFDVRVFPANLNVAQGATALAKIKAYRRDGFNEEILVAVEGLPPGFLASPATIPKGQSEARFTITAPADAVLGVISPTFTATATVGEQTIERQAVPAEELMQAFYYWQDVPTKELLLAVVQPTAFALSSSVSTTEVHEVQQGGTLSVVVGATRDGLKLPIEWAEAGKKVAEEALAEVKADVQKAKDDYAAAEKAAKEALAAVAKADADGKAQATKAAAEKRKLADAAKAKPVTLAVDEKAAAAKLAAAAKTLEAAKAVAVGKISLKVDTPPKGITVKAASIADGEKEATITITVTNQAPVGFLQNIIVSGTIRASGETITRFMPAIPIKVIAVPEKK